METKEKIRHDLYGYLEDTFGVLDKKMHVRIKELLLAHEKATGKQQAKQIKAVEKIAWVKNKISSYVAKASKIKGNPKIDGNLETLKQVLNWLNQDTD